MVNKNGAVLAGSCHKMGREGVTLVCPMNGQSLWERRVTGMGIWPAIPVLVMVNSYDHLT